MIKMKTKILYAEKTTII